MFSFFSFFFSEGEGHESRPLGKFFFFRDEKSKGRERKREPIVTKNQSKRKKSHAQIYLKKYGDHVREIVPAPLFQEGNAHFDGA
jgi:hypothetical protein